MKIKPFQIVILISGNGSNLQAIIDQIEDNDLPIQIAAVISNKADAYGLQRADIAGIATRVIDNKAYESRDAFDAAVQQTIDKYAPDLVVLAGFMRILTDDFVNHYLGKMINIHPSLLPEYRGLNTHQRAIDDKKKHHGASVHYVTPELDDGPIILQSAVSIDENDDATSLAQKVHREEHRIYPLAIRWIAERRLQWKQGEIYLDGEKLESPKIYQELDC